MNLETQYQQALELTHQMLACAKIGAVHSVVFSGFWAKAFHERANDAQIKVAITVDGFYRRGKVIPLKENVDQVLDDIPSLEKLIESQYDVIGVFTQPDKPKGRGHKLQSSPDLVIILLFSN